MFDQQKFILKSKTVIGALILAAGVTAQLAFGVELAPDDTAEFSDKAMAVTVAIAELVGLVLVFWGRYTAKTTVGMSSTPPAGTQFGGYSSRSGLWVLAFLLLVPAGAMTQPGCSAIGGLFSPAKTDEQKVTEAEEYLTFVARTVEDAANRDQLSANVRAAARAGLLEADALLDEANARLAAGGSIDVEFYVMQSRRILERVLGYLEHSSSE